MPAIDPDVARRLAAIPRVALGHYPTPVEELPRLQQWLGTRVRLLVKRDDAIAFAMGGNKVRKAQLAVAEAIGAGADTLITTGGIQSNHARVTAGAAARCGLGCVLVANGGRPPRLAGNALLDDLYGAQVEYVATRADRTPAMEAIAARLRAEGRRPAIIPLGASTPLGAIGYLDAMIELLGQIDPPDVIVHSTSSGGTQAGLLAGCALARVPTRVVGISADDPAPSLRAGIDGVLAGMEELLSLSSGSLRGAPIEADDRFVGEGYGIETAGSREALRATARQEALLLDPTYTAKAMAGLFAHVRERTWPDGATVVFWHTGGQVGLFA